MRASLLAFVVVVAGAAGCDGCNDASSPTPPAATAKAPEPSANVPDEARAAVAPVAAAELKCEAAALDMLAFGKGTGADGVVRHIYGADCRGERATYGVECAAGRCGEPIESSKVSMKGSREGMCALILAYQWKKRLSGPNAMSSVEQYCY